MTDHRIVTREQWLSERRDLLAQEKAFTKARDDLSRKRRELPWVAVDQSYTFVGPEGERSLGELFGKRNQLLVYHFMYGPDWEQGCPSCSFWADNFNGIDVHLAHRDISLVLVSRTEIAKIEAYKKRMGWTLDWVSSLGSTFNRDFDVSFTPEELEAKDMFYNFRRTSFPSSEGPGASAFIKDDEGRVFHTYSTYSRGLDMLNGAYHLMDIAPKGRDEEDLAYSMAWLARRDQYED